MISPVRMYTTAYCPYCQRAEQLLKARGVADIEKIRVDLEPELRTQMMQKTGRRTVPQIYIGEHHVGGFDDLAVLDREGRLEPMLRGTAAATDTQTSTISPKAPS
jgi:glutaredoxin 3